VTASSAPDTTAQAGQISYKDTLNLLQTPFAMRANAKVREPEIQAFWAQQRLYERLSQQNPGETFTLHDGPPCCRAAKRGLCRAGTATACRSSSRCCRA
jgi:isoleucyl-tRNA synthetase